jgi:hypothetical protein
MAKERLQGSRRRIALTIECGEKNCRVGAFVCDYSTWYEGKYGCALFDETDLTCWPENMPLRCLECLERDQGAV